MREIDGYILAGGAGKRMGGPKAEIVVGGKRLIDIAAETLGSVCGERIKIVGNVRIADPPFPMIGDMPDPEGSVFPGPLFGLMAALEDARSEWIAVLACDMPFVTPELLELIADTDMTRADCVIPIQPDGRQQPLCALYRRDSSLAGATEAIRKGGRSVHFLIDLLEVNRVDFEMLKGLSGSQRFFANLNTPFDAELASKQVRE
jgi:molybdenum cofactor guanylyltransferase